MNKFWKTLHGINQSWEWINRHFSLPGADKSVSSLFAVWGGSHTFLDVQNLVTSQQTWLFLYQHIVQCLHSYGIKPFCSYWSYLFLTAKCLVRVTAFPTVQKHLHGEIFMQWCIMIIVRVPAVLPKFVKMLWEPFSIVIHTSQWYKEFQFGRTTFEDLPLRPACEHCYWTYRAKVECLMKEDPRITENEVKSVLIFHREP